MSFLLQLSGLPQTLIKTIGVPVIYVMQEMEMNTGQKHVLVIRQQLPNREKISPVLLPMTFQRQDKLFQHNMVGKRPGQCYVNAI